MIKNFTRFGVRGASFLFTTNSKRKYFLRRSKMLLKRKYEFGWGSHRKLSYISSAYVCVSGMDCIVYRLPPHAACRNFNPYHLPFFIIRRYVIKNIMSAKSVGHKF